MRAVFAAICVAGILASVVSAGPLSRDKRFAGVFTSAGTYPFFPNFGAFAATPYAAAVANPFMFPGFGFGFGQPGVNRNPVFSAIPDFSQSVPYFASFMPSSPFMPKMPELKNWHDGPNVCKEVKILNTQKQDDVMPADWKVGLPNMDTDFSHEQESCQGNNGKYVCTKRVIGNNGEVQVIATKYECCHGFVRDPTGAPGCVESKQSGASQGTNTKLTQNDPTYYMYTGNSMQGSSSSSVSRSSSGNLDKVPLQ